ncbi:restriction endonuclease subunit S [Alteromonas sp. 14N.309.X.WAT.G.H12]|uniref:restriction endonuclease subunit S n=1 Tax=Alteromonas sp. 14N.309.X.WAT.G.H12 TaxID=3120824 RepID=UPI002FD0091B
MSHLNYLEKLLEGVGTEWQALGDLVTLRRGRVMSKGFLSENTGIFPVYSSQTANDGMIGSIDTYDFDGEYISWTTDGANAGTIFYRKGKFSITNVCGLMKIIDENLLNYKYLYYWLTTEAKKYVYSGMGNPKLMSHQVEKISVPIPCPDNPEKSLAIQAEIVRILDSFTAMTAELTAELNLRKKQYNYYRDQLLSFEEGEVEWKTLGEIGTWYGGGTPSKNNSEFWENGTIPWVSPKDMGNPIVDSSEDYITEDAIKNSSTKLVPPNSIALVVRSSILDKKLPSALIPVPVTLNQDMKAVIPHNSILSSYIAHMISSRGNDILRTAKKTGGSVASIDSKKLFSFLIPIPNLDEQQRIVSILDKFDTLANSIQEGLPREIELRQKQYEYYRDLLLSFPASPAGEPKSHSDEAA